MCNMFIHNDLMIIFTNKIELGCEILLKDPYYVHKIASTYIFRK